MTPAENMKLIAKLLEEQDPRAATYFKWLFHRVERLVEALEEIKLGSGPYSQDRLKHAENCIEAMKEEARKALEEDT